jgi:hypothetical protein
LRIEMEAGAVEIGAGEFYVVPRVCATIRWAKSKTTLHSGNEINEKSRAIEEQQRGV